MQAILSGDPFLEEVLRHNLRVAPPTTHFIWLLDEDDTEAQRLTSSLQQEKPTAVTVLLCPPPVGNVNPKTSKLEIGLASVRSEFVAVLDDDT